MLKTVISQGEDLECNRCGYAIPLGERYSYDSLTGTVTKCSNCPSTTVPTGGLNLDHITCANTIAKSAKAGAIPAHSTTESGA